MDLGSTLRHSAKRNPQKPAVICDDQIVSYEALDRSTNALARWLLREGLATGDRVAIHWSNSVEVVNLYFACFKAGLIAVPVNNRLKAPEIAYILGHSKAKLCFSQPELAPLCEEARAECPDLRRIYTALPALETTDSEGIALPDVAPDRVAAILYTSGTTARPKGVMHTHVSLVGATELMILLGIDETHALLAVTQMVHIAALACALLPGISCGGTVVLLPAFDGPRVLDLIERWRCTFFVILPAMLRFVVEEQGCTPRDVSSVRLCLAGGDTVPVTLQERFRALFGVPVRELFGMTETVPITCIREDAPRTGSVGPAMDLVDARVADLTGKVVADGQVGELQVQSPANCVGYWDDPKATAATFEDGWLRTGDLVRRDADGFYWFEGRVKQIIVRGGSNISPQEVEEALYHHPAVLEAGVIGMPDPVHGEKVIAFVALREGFKAGEQELRDLVRSRIADYKTPERIVFLPVLPKGLTGKVQRRALKDLVVEGRAAGA
ncbi:AMP-dependent synthetase and ligase [Candidatus Sulfopaludibacter sp. SbA4]|nr:AMP-dependent synthetase and ligase [Candidatus Sulfopaludibacter sp. SbA4]